MSVSRLKSGRDCKHENTEEITVVRPAPFFSNRSTEEYKTKRCLVCYWKQQIGGSQFVDPAEEVNPWGGVLIVR